MRFPDAVFLIAVNISICVRYYSVLKTKLDLLSDTGAVVLEEKILDAFWLTLVDPNHLTRILEAKTLFSAKTLFYRTGYQRSLY
jgi:hypothetical protein